MKIDYSILIALPGGIVALWLVSAFLDASAANRILIAFIFLSLLCCICLFGYHLRSPEVKKRKDKAKAIEEIPEALKKANGVYLGREKNLGISLYLPDSIRLRHVHIIGATGSGKSESVILNFLLQDAENGKGAIILDAKGDRSFLETLQKFIPSTRLQVFDLGSEASKTYNPLFLGNHQEACQRLFSSLTWSEEYYKSKAFTALQRIFERCSLRGTNPTLAELTDILSEKEKFTDAVVAGSYTAKNASEDYDNLSGLRDQIASLAGGYLKTILSPKGEGDLRLATAKEGAVLYFRLQSLMSPRIVSTVGKLLINNLNYLAGLSHRGGSSSAFVPTFLDEFASFACVEFADLISKARSAGLALHFSHQSIGDLASVDEGFLGRITDNSATKIVLRVNDPDTAEFFARSFGTKLYQKATQRVTNAQEIQNAEILGEGTIREAHQFRASPDLLKSLPTGSGAVLVSHGFDSPQGATSVFNIQFPKLKEGK